MVIRKRDTSTIDYSIFTPTNNPIFLEDAYQSLVNQSITEWEWIVGLNNYPRSNVDPTLLSKLLSDSRVRLVELPDTSSIGALKKQCCTLAKGQYLVELDHDDILAPNTLFELGKQFNKGVDFVHSAWFEFSGQGDDTRYHLYGAEYGWVYKTTSLPWVKQFKLNPTVEYNIPFDITPSALGAIHFAPNHVRSWRKSFYDKIGGHNEKLSVCDDYELIIRTYLAGGLIGLIDEPIYGYRRRSDKSNSYLVYNNSIQELQAQLSKQYRLALAEEWCHRSELLKVDMGGAHNTIATVDNGWYVLDAADNTTGLTRYLQTDIITSGIPLPDNSVGLIRAVDFLEHIPHCANSSCLHGKYHKQTKQGGVPVSCTVGLMNEFYRVLAPNGVLITSTPSTDGRGAFQDPTHVSFWNSNSFWYYTQADKAAYIRNEHGCRYQEWYKEDYFPSAYHSVHNIPYTNAGLIALKGQRQAGKTYI